MPKNPPASAVVKSARNRWRSLSKGTQLTLGIILLLLILIRLALPSAITKYVNHQLDKHPDYDGSIRELDVHLWRGAYQIHDVKIVKTDGDVPVPLFAARRLDLSMEWKAILHGALVGEVIMDEPEINFVAGDTPDRTQTGKDRDWAAMLESLFPFKINRLQINNGKVRFNNFESEPPVDIFAENVFAVATNLTNARDLPEPLPSGITASGRTLGAGELELQLQINLAAIKPTFELVAQVTNVNLVSLNDFLKAYGKFDVERGTFSIYSSFAVAEGKYDGYAKVFFDDLDVFAWEKERKKNILQVFWQAIVGTVSTVFRNLPKDQLATKIPISGSYEGTDVGAWTAVATLLQNAFISALVPKVDQTITIEEIKNDSGSEQADPSP